MLADCPIPGARGTLRPEGSGANGVMLLGEALGEHEVEAGLPFRPEAPAGSVLERAIRRCGYEREAFVLWNTVPVQPPNNYLEGAPYEAEAIAWGLPQLDAVVERFRPRVVLCLGNVALRAVTGLGGVMTNRGYPIASRWPGVWAVGTIHPSYIRRGATSYFGVLMHDVRLAVELARGRRWVSFWSPVRWRDVTYPLPAARQVPPGYILAPSEHDAATFAEVVERDCSLVIAYDIETPHPETEEDEPAEVSEITSIQFSIAPDTGIYLPWREPFLPYIRRILATPNCKVGANNWRFDNPLLRANGCALGGEIHDLRWAWKHYQPDLSAGLQFIASFYVPELGPWKFLDASMPQFYGIRDVDATLRCFHLLLDDLRDRGMMTSYRRYVVMIEQVLTRTSERGMPVSPEAYASARAEAEARVAALFERMQQLVPDDCKPKREYKRKPTAILPFRPSNKALVAYMRYRGHSVPQAWKTQRDTTNQDELKRLAHTTGDPLYECVLAYRDAQALLSNHLKNWQPCEPAGDACTARVLGCGGGRVHPIFYYTATGQLAARRPNTMNAPRHRESQGKLFRSIVCARPGYELLSFDYAGYHALYLAHESGDSNFARLVRLDVHSFLTAHFLRLPDAERCLDWDNEQLAQYLRWVRTNHKQVRDAKAKHALLGYNNGMGWRKLYFMYRDFFDNQAEARRLMELLDKLFPVAAKWRQQICELAHEQGYLMSRFGCVRYFWEVKRWQGGRWSHGDDAEAAISFLQQNHAHCHLKDVMLRLDAMGALERYGFVTPIHDDLTFECPAPLVPEAIEVIKREMEAPNPVTGLSVAVETKRGPRWSDMTEC